MATSSPASRTWGSRTGAALIPLLVVQLISIGGMLPYYAVARQDSLQLRIVALGLALFALFTMASVWLRKRWAVWAVLALVACKLTVDLFNWALTTDRIVILFSQVINISIIVLVFRQTEFGSARVTPAQKIFFGFVLALAAWVGFWGMFLPRAVDRALPFTVPPLHARFLGVMYLSGATFMLFGILAKAWAEVRVVVPMIAIWTGMLGLVSLFHLEAFDWSRTQVWFWFIAYSAYPLIAAWITWQHRSQQERASGAAVSTTLRTYFLLQGGLVTVLALSLLAAPGFMTTVWPWKITPVLAHIYAAPFLSYGLGSLYAARQHRWAEVRIPVYATLVFTLGVLIASLLHANLFSFGAPAAWVWFGSFGLAALALALFGSVPSLRIQREMSPTGVATSSSTTHHIDTRGT